MQRAEAVDPVETVLPKGKSAGIRPDMDDILGLFGSGIGQTFSQHGQGNINRKNQLGVMRLV